ncbi:hypothetical protein [Actinomadura sp. 9N407]|uniref:hypothetical protein n=1 Tax=Actinomadura sp. 9N407 TaxID=3375154 RepID=UPI003794BF6D
MPTPMVHGDAGSPPPLIPMPTLPPMAWPTPTTAPEPGAEMALVSPAGNEVEGRDWLAVAAIVLVAEAALLWLVACAALLRRRLAMERADREE